MLYLHILYKRQSQQEFRIANIYGEQNISMKSMSNVLKIIDLATFDIQVLGKLYNILTFRNNIFFRF